MKEVIRDRNFNVLGYIDVDAAGRRTALDRNLNLLGYFDPDRDETFDREQNIVARGNVLSSLIHGSTQEERRRIPAVFATIHSRSYTAEEITEINRKLNEK